MENNRALITLLSILTIIATGVVLKAAQVVVIPLVIAWLLSHLLTPPLNFMASKGVPRSIASTILILAMLFSTYLFGNFGIRQLRPLTGQIDEYQTQLIHISNKISSDFHNKFTFLNGNDTPEPTAEVPEISSPPEPPKLEAVPAITTNTMMTAELPPPTQTPNLFAQLNWGAMVKLVLVTASGSVVSLARNLVLVTVVLFFLLLGKPYFRYKMLMIFNRHDAEQVRQMEKNISSDISRYLLVQFLISAVTGILVWLSLSLLEIDFAATWGMLAFFLNFIPTLGSIIASIPPILVAMVQYYPVLSKPILVLITLLAIQQIMGNFLTPKVLGDRLDLSPVTILVSLLFFGWMWGIVGALMATPLAVILKLLCAQIEMLRPLSIMMSSGRTLKERIDAEAARGT